MRLAHCAHALRIVVATVAVASLGGCATARIRVQPAPASVAAGAAISPAAIALAVDDQITTYHAVARTSAVAAGPGYATIEVEFELGAALGGVIEQAMRAHFREVTDAAACTAESRFLLRAEFAKPPELHIRWLQRMVSEGGGATVDLALAVSAQRCGGPIVWRAIVTGYGAAELIESNFLWTTPAAAQFQPAVDAALADLAQHLDAALSAATQKELNSPS